MMITSHVRGHRSASAAVLAIGGGALAVALWISGDVAFALVAVAFYAIAATVAYLWSGRDGDVAAILRSGGDERQRGLDRDATAITGLAMAGAAIIGAIVETARGQDPAGYGVLCVVGGVTYVVSLFVLRRRRS
jgi:hypothetical protein